MTVPWQKVHVFIGSTFNNMHAERDYLVKRVFPELADWCVRRKLRLVDVDLRWGVTEADATSNANVVRTCLKRIDDCRPFFVCLLGQRYGWAPTKDDVSPETLSEHPHLQVALAAGASVTEKEILHAIVKPFRDARGDLFARSIGYLAALERIFASTASDTSMAVTSLKYSRKISLTCAAAGSAAAAGTGDGLAGFSTSPIWSRLLLSGRACRV